MRLRTEVIIGSILTGVFLLVIYVEYAGISKMLTPLSPVRPSSTIQTNTSTQSSNVSLTLEEISKHNSERDCWLIIDRDVYDVTNYLRLHPGGVSRITRYCGTDATQAYATQGGEGSHSGTADGQKDMLKIGALNGTTDTTTIQNVQETTDQQAPIQRRREFDDD